MISDVLFDLDDTLCDFSGARRRGLDRAFGGLIPTGSAKAVALWTRIEPTLFTQFATGELSLAGYRSLRFGLVLSALDMTPASPAEAEALIRSMNESFMQEVNDLVEECPGARRCLRELGRRGLRCHLLTNGPSDGQRRKIVRLELHTLVDQVLIGEEIGASKPAIAAFTYAIERIGRPADQIVMVGNDLECDVLPAREAGLHAVHYAPGGSDYRPTVRRLDEIERVMADLQ